MSSNKIIIIEFLLLITSHALTFFGSMRLNRALLIAAFIYLNELIIVRITTKLKFKKIIYLGPKIAFQLINAILQLNNRVFV